MAITCRWDILSLLAYSDTHKVLYKARRRRQYLEYGEAAQRRTGLCGDCDGRMLAVAMRYDKPCFVV